MTASARSKSKYSSSETAWKTKGELPLTSLSSIHQPTLTRLHSVDEEEITLQTAALREKLLSASSSKSNAKNLKPHQVHELAKAKMEENEKLRKALEISEDYEEGSHWRKQEERAREAGLGDKSVKERDE
jgi:hypothetical protein